MSHRLIDRGIFRDDLFDGMKSEWRLLWIGLFTVCADDQGRIANNPAVIRAMVFPFDDIGLEDIRAGLEYLASKNRILLYASGVNGSTKNCIQILNWWRYQKGSWATKSQLPAPPDWQDWYCYRTPKNTIEKSHNPIGGWSSDDASDDASPATSDDPFLNAHHDSDSDYDSDHEQVIEPEQQEPPRASPFSTEEGHKVNTRHSKKITNDIAAALAGKE